MAKALPKALTAHDVFTPGAFPEHTYVARGDEDELLVPPAPPRPESSGVYR